MFNRIKQSMVIERAYEIWRRDMGLDVKNLISTWSFADAAAYREGLRDMQEKMGLGQYDVVVMMICPFLDLLDMETKESISFAVDQWLSERRIQPGVHDFFGQRFRGFV